MATGYLTLIPTPIDESLPLETVALETLRLHALDEQAILLVEEHKIARQRWLKWGLPRESIERFVLFNEHTQEKEIPDLLKSMRGGKKAFLMSDGGLPAFCDPGQSLVNACHEKAIRVTSTPFPNSIALAVALSGFRHQEFYFAGFLPANADERKRALEKIQKLSVGPSVIMDTPYRLQSLLKDLAQSQLKNRKVFVATELNKPSERLFRGTLTNVLQEMGSLNKVEFVLVLDEN